MNITQTVAQVEAVFHDLDIQIRSFQQASSLHCPSECGKCCFKPDIEATVLEFLPFAHFLYQNDLAWPWYDRLCEDKTGLCPILASAPAGAGWCTQYAHRGLICRLFGYSARLSKYGRKEMVTCTVIKTGQAAAYRAAVQRTEAGQPIPVMSDFYMRLHAIDADLSREFFPIREAIRRALETVLHHYAYRSSRQ